MKRTACLEHKFPRLALALWLLIVVAAPAAAQVASAQAAQPLAVSVEARSEEHTV